MSTTELTDSGNGTPQVTDEQIPVYIMGKRYLVPSSLTIMKAMEYAGYQYTRGAGCRGGICGACATVYRKPGDYHIRTGLACQTVVEADMYLTQLPFYPANRTTVDFDALEGIPEEVHSAYPELFRCVACNACTKVCPMDVEVLDYVSALKRGDLKAAAEISFDCIQCGLCASRCFAEMPQYHIAQLARRLYGGKLAPRAQHLAKMVSDIDEGRYDDALDELMAMKLEDLRNVYSDREQEPVMGDESWRPKNNIGL